MHLTLRIVRTARVWTPVKQGPLEEVVLREVKNIDSIGWAIREQEGLEDPACEDWDVRVSTYDTTFKWEIKFDSWILLFFFIDSI